MASVAGVTANLLPETKETNLPETMEQALNIRCKDTDVRVFQAQSSLESMISESQSSWESMNTYLVAKLKNPRIRIRMKQVTSLFFGILLVTGSICFVTFKIKAEFENADSVSNVNHFLPPLHENDI